MDKELKKSDEGVTLTVIGSGDAFGSGGRRNTCFHVASQSGQFLIDCGATSLIGLKQSNISTENIDAIVISHFHGDHYGGLPYFLLQSAVYGRIKPLIIISPPDCEKKLRNLLDLLYPSSTVLEKLNLEFREYHLKETIDIGFLSVQVYPVIHTEAAMPHGLRIRFNDKIISYSGDTEWTDNLIDLARNADLFICECNFYQSRVKGHLNYLDLKQNIKKLSYKRILLTHFDDEMLDKLGSLDIECADDGIVLTL